MLPVRYLEDLKTAPIQDVDFVGTFIEMFEGKYTTFGSRSTLHPRVVRTSLNANVEKIMPDIHAEVRDAFEAIWPDSEDWTAVPVVDCITRIVARVSGRMFGGPELSRNDEWVMTSIRFALNGFAAAQKLKLWPEVLKPFAAPFISELKAIREDYRSAEKAALPILEQRKTSNKKANDLLTWMAENARGEEAELKFVSHILLKVSFAAIHTSAAAPCQLIFDLCQYSQYVDVLRDEIRKNTTIEDHQTLPKVGNLIKLDSIMKESQRINPLLLITFERIITRDYALKDGLVIPAHTTIGMPTQAINMDPEHYYEPDKFDGLRFYNLKVAGTSASKTDYVASNGASLNFGYGRHACPGRWFAANEIKSIMAYLLLNYDIKFADGQSRPENLQVETQNLPNPTATVLSRRIRRS
ncbi:hypothetical protein AUEXF2481DRAFT_36669 [Aureobasidium subglaciale EXF-2481]|uniref:Cytochrome P450 n=1 Tax=Aureobasidium subglaciale (strain EXF-2481) TaxID=1043005 RepID=A0A074YPW6_AURSE|nr:uncharacterized protein AUEXF2481DRAFT_36669 [Aureobasidium subglaciale EXF-2481]KEQ98169.1 hypothetical protein AUEXF2481DRAFT_36669 [Aureobasidium subglaciale EXF-2481]